MIQFRICLLETYKLQYFVSIHFSVRQINNNPMFCIEYESNLLLNVGNISRNKLIKESKMVGETPDTYFKEASTKHIKTMYVLMRYAAKIHLTAYCTKIHHNIYCLWRKKINVASIVAFCR